MELRVTANIDRIKDVFRYRILGFTVPLPSKGAFCGGCHAAGGWGQ